MLLTVGILLSFCPLALPQDESVGNARMRREAAFAKALTYEFGYTDLAERVLDEALKTASGSDRSLLLLTRCDIRKLGAGLSKDNPSRLAAQASAGAAYVEFLNGNPPESQAAQARVKLGELAYQYGRTLTQILEEDPPTPEKRQEMLSTAENIFKAALKGLNQTIRTWEAMPEGDEKTAQQRSDYFPANFYKAMVYLDWAELYPAGSLERDERSSKALELLEDFSLLVGETSRAGMMGFKYMGDAYTLRGEYEDAQTFYEHVIENALPEDALDKLTDAEIDGRRGVVQEAYLSLMRMELKQGRMADAAQLGETFRTWVDDEGVILTDAGYRVLLEIARERILSRKFGEALAFADRVHRENEGKALQLEADQVMAEAIAAAPANAPISLDTVFQAARGAFYSHLPKRARELFLMLLQRLPGSNQADEIGPESYYLLGRIYADEDLRLEAAVTFQTGYEQFPDDEDFAPKNAQRWMNTADALRNAAPGDKILNDFYNQAMTAVTESSTGGAPDQALWRAATSDYGLAKEARHRARGKSALSQEAQEALAAYDQALTDYQRIEKASRYYEKAIVQSGMCEYWKMLWDDSAGSRAFGIFDDYLEHYTKDPENTPQDARARKTRTEATAQADFYRGQVRLRQARAGDSSKWQEVLDLYAEYGKRHPEQKSYAGAALAAEVEAYLALGKEKEAVAVFEAVNSGGFQDARIAQVAHMLFAYEQAKADQAQGKEKKALQRLAANYLHIANSHTATVPWQNLLQEARLRLATGEASTAATLLEKILREDSDSPDFDENSKFYTRLDLVDALLAQDKTSVAAPIIDELLASRPTNLRVIQASVKVLAGYAQVRNGKVVEVPGVGTKEAFEKATQLVTTLTQLAENAAVKSGVNKFQSADYWKARLSLAYLLYRRSKIDSSYQGKHLALIESLERLAPDLGAEAAGEDVHTLFQWLKTR